MQADAGQSNFKKMIKGERIGETEMDVFFVFASAGDRRRSIVNNKRATHEASSEMVPGNNNGNLG